jgi:tripartite-type tricarboxylate transporter receptor subunit TctC
MATLKNPWSSKKQSNAWVKWVGCRRMIAAAILIGLLNTSAIAQGSDYPNRAIRVIVAVGPGGVGDLFMRALGERLSETLRQPIVIENKPGGAFNIAARVCADSSPDGYTICLLPGEPLTYNQFLFKDIGYDPVNGFEPITNLFFITQVLAVNSSLGVKDLPGLAALSKQKAGTLSYSSPALAQTLFVEKFKRKNGADLVWIPFKSGGDAMANFMSGSVPVVFLGLGNVISFIESGKANVLVTDGEKRSPLIPDVPTVREVGYTGDITRSYFGLVAPAKTPPNIIGALNNAIALAFKDNEFVQKQLIAKGLDPAMSTPSEFAEFLVKDRRAAEQVVAASGRKVQ